MSLLSWHTLSWDDERITEDQVARATASMLFGQDQAEKHLEQTRDIILGNRPARWPEQDRHGCRLSLLWPGTVFTADTTGEDGERWRTFYRDGLFYTEHPTLPEFSEHDFALRAQPA